VELLEAGRDVVRPAPKAVGLFLLPEAKGRPEAALALRLPA
jgi:hypothetical protein